ncbi:hypothetical protein F5Y04DRAFT_1182 [Hypomontagnella monticulosa]|nr:hypothetical protein F5Y04DRAFT_1182 [Hypomontagnella monticulosa]
MPSFFVTSAVCYILYRLAKFVCILLHHWMLTLLDRDVPNIPDTNEMPGVIPPSPSPSPPPPPPPNTPKTPPPTSPVPNKKRWGFVGDPATLQARIGLGVGLPTEPSPFDSVVHETQDAPGNVESAGKERFKRALCERRVPSTPQLPPWATPTHRATEWPPLPFDPYNPPADPHRRFLVGNFWMLEDGIQARAEGSAQGSTEVSIADLITRRASPDPDNASTIALYGSERDVEDNFEDLAEVDDASPISMSSLSSLTTMTDSEEEVEETEPLLGEEQQGEGEQQEEESAGPVNLEGALCTRPHPRIHPLYAAKHGDDPNWNFGGSADSKE